MGGQKRKTWPTRVHLWEIVGMAAAIASVDALWTWLT